MSHPLRPMPMQDLTELLASLETIREMRHAAEAGKNPLGTVPVGGDDVRRVRLHELARAVCLGAVNYENPAVAIAAFKEFRRCAKLEAPGPDAEAAAAELPSLAHSVLLVAGRMRRRQESGMLGRVLHSEAPGVPVGELFIAKAASGDVRSGPVHRRARPIPASLAVWQERNVSVLMSGRRRGAGMRGTHWLRWIAVSSARSTLKPSWRGWRPSSPRNGSFATLTKELSMSNQLRRSCLPRLCLPSDGSISETHSKRSTISSRMPLGRCRVSVLQM
jgi:hypothetical protein